MCKNVQFGNSNGGYDVSELGGGPDGVAACFNLPCPAPR